MTNNILSTFTREAALSVTAGAEVKRFVARAAKVATDATERVDMAGVAAAYATHAALRTGYLGGSDGMAQSEYAAMFGKSASVVTLWKRLGIAFVDSEVDPMSDLGRVLRSGGANVKSIADVLTATSEDGKPASAEDIRKAAAEVYQTGTDGALVPKKKRTERPAANTGGETKVEVPRNNSTRLDMVEACLAAIADDTITPGIAKRLGEVAETLSAMLDRKVARTA